MANLLFRGIRSVKMVKITVEVPVTNKGGREGSEIVELYISDLKSPLPRPVKELKGFSKIKLAPGRRGL